MLILVLLGMYFDAAVVFVKTSSLLFIFALAILWMCNVLENKFEYIKLYFFSQPNKKLCTLGFDHKKSWNIMKYSGMFTSLF